jgi:hypothetical protein
MTPLPATPPPSSQSDPPPVLVLVRMGALTTVHLPGPKVGLGDWLKSNQQRKTEEVA